MSPGRPQPENKAELFGSSVELAVGCSRTAFGDEASCRRTISWFAEFKRGRVNFSEEFRIGCPSTVVNNKDIDIARYMIETDRHVTYHGIRASLGIGMNQIQSILHKHLSMKKQCSWWIPYNLTEAQKRDRFNSYANALSSDVGDDSRADCVTDED
ncbi:Histone-lysine N-methyltransferase SETMAR [Eumeta japonica]|uniref:Histone-lysine N-methyltransferase SETMAR n=1 Tax=Eumeta variegata TaxID=151549 RepID=A0A4C1VY73_EUMVA|nr:Histone-lysine N-methyltransferase SETMAR [Eumeta japonica]